MLGSLLPGLREFRTPLSIGVLWLAMVWLLFGEALSEASESDGSLPSRVRNLAEAMPSTLVVAAAALVAYALGVAIGMTSPPAVLSEMFEDNQFNPETNGPFGYLATKLGVAHREDEGRISENWSATTLGVASLYWSRVPRPVRVLSRWRRRLPEALRWRASDMVARSEWSIRRAEELWTSLGKWLKPPRQFGNVGYRVRDRIDTEIEALTRTGASITGIFETQALTPYAARAAGEIIGHAYAIPAADRDADSQEATSKDVIGRSILESIEYDLQSVASKLQERESELFDTYDRLRAESEFRIGTSLPVAALSIAVAFRHESLYSLPVLAIALFLFARGWKLTYEAQSLLWSAVLYEIVAVPELENLTGTELDATRTPESVWDEAMRDIEGRGFTYDPDVGLVT